MLRVSIVCFTCNHANRNSRFVLFKCGIDRLSTLSLWIFNLQRRLHFSTLLFHWRLLLIARQCLSLSKDGRNKIDRYQNVSLTIREEQSLKDHHDQCRHEIKCCHVATRCKRGRFQDTSPKNFTPDSADEKITRKWNFRLLVRFSGGGNKKKTYGLHSRTHAKAKWGQRMIYWPFNFSNYSLVTIAIATKHRYIP